MGVGTLQLTPPIVCVGQTLYTGCLSHTPPHTIGRTVILGASNVWDQSDQTLSGKARI